MTEERVSITEFSKRVGIVATAALAVLALANTLGGAALNAVVVPQIERIVERERLARVAGDSTLAVAVTQISRDRIALLAVVTQTPGPARTRMVERLMEQWQIIPAGSR